MNIFTKSHWIVCGVLVLALGCGDKDLVDHSQDPDRFAASVKQQVVTAVADARGNDEPADALWSLVDAVDPEVLEHRPVGNHADTYQQIHAIANQLYEQADASGSRPADLGAKLDELESLADQLPGEVRVDTDED